MIPPKGKEHKPQEEPDINFSVEFSLEKGRQWINSFFEAISSMHDLLEYEPYKPALMRVAWEGVNSQGVSETIYSDAYEFSDKDMVIANYNIMRIFNKHNNLLP